MVVTTHLFVCFSQEAMASPLCDRIYLTEIMAEFEADVFFSGVDETHFRKIE